MTDNKFKRVKANTDFVQDVNSDVKQENIQIVKTKNQSQVAIEKNQLSLKERSRVKHGRSLTIPLFVEELDIIEQTVEKLLEQSNTSISNFIRQAVLDKCLSVLGQEEFSRMNADKRNVVKK